MRLDNIYLSIDLDATQTATRASPGQRLNAALPRTLSFLSANTAARLRPEVAIRVNRRQKKRLLLPICPRQIPIPLTISRAITRQRTPPVPWHTALPCASTVWTTSISILRRAGLAAAAPVGAAEHGAEERF